MPCLLDCAARLLAKNWNSHAYRILSELDVNAGAQPAAAREATAHRLGQLSVAQHAQTRPLPTSDFRKWRGRSGMAQPALG
jgi:hypothetical protein